MKKIQLLAIDGCLSSSVANLNDTFTIVNLCHKALTQTSEDLFTIRIVTPGGKPVACSQHFHIWPDLATADNKAADYLLIPAFLPVPDSSTLRNQDVLDYIIARHAAGTTVASVCTGAFLLAETGLLNGRIATTNWQFANKFRFRYPDVELQIDRVLTEQDNLICSGAVTALMHLVLRIVQREGTSELVSTCAKALLVNPGTTSQAPFAMHRFTELHRDTTISQAETYMREHLAESFTIDQVAEAVCLSPRHFKRRFKQATGDPPLAYLQQLRVESAKAQLEKSLDNIDEIARRVGYEDSSAFRRLFKRHTSLSPKEYRDRFQLPTGI